ncbi:VOC family protein [Mycetocola lacteus]|uniref:VOC family protein n=1 Tax=Mycetocola lacteus TaxID=76637 RepID=A0A3L7AHB0_9MICO|nr:VOC family protein [Mycetocola lacteus]RLP79863.1 VOC family protein [Mycetocola lacteus]
MTVSLNPYINFRGEGRAALEFYHGIFGGELTVSTFGEAGMPVDPADANLIMHGMIVSPSGLTLMVSDTPSYMELTVGDNVSVSLSGPDEAELRGYWEGLLPGANVQAPLETAPWGDTFGMLVDSFGIGWLVNITAN